MALQMLSGTIKKVFAKELEQEDKYENKFSVSVLIETDAGDVWLSFGGKKYAGLQVQDSGEWKFIGEGSQIMAKYEVNGNFNNCKVSDVFVTKFVQGQEWVPRGKQASKGTSNSSSEEYTKNYGMEVGNAINASVLYLGQNTNLSVIRDTTVIFYDLIQDLNNTTDYSKPAIGGAIKNAAFLCKGADVQTLKDFTIKLLDMQLAVEKHVVSKDKQDNKPTKNPDTTSAEKTTSPPKKTTSAAITNTVSTADNNTKQDTYFDDDIPF